MVITASLVLFNTPSSQYSLSIHSFLNSCNGFLYVMDNSAQPLNDQLFEHPRVHYEHANANLGFGKAHNKAFASISHHSDLHLILNPDIAFDPDVLPTISKYFECYQEVGALMPKIVYPDGNLQFLCKLLPTPCDLIFRRFLPFATIKRHLNKRYELHALPQDRPMSVPVVSGCFLIVRTNLLRQVGGFDERFFMYMEDVDLVRRIGDAANIVYLPSVKVVHDYAKGSYANIKLLNYHIESAVRYFFKWGWFFDGVRKNRNSLIIKALTDQ